MGYDDDAALFGDEPAKETERTMLDRLRLRYSQTFKNGSYVGRRYVIAEHVALDPGAWRGTRIADAIVLDTWSESYGKLTATEKETARWGNRQTIHGFEVKVSRADWLTELRDPEKAEAWARHCHYFWLVAADKRIVQDDLPDGWGLLVPHGRSLRVARTPTRRDIEPMTTSTITSLARGVQKTEGKIAVQRAGETDGSA